VEYSRWRTRGGGLAVALRGGPWSPAEQKLPGCDVDHVVVLVFLLVQDRALT
jgi:hypothetical protein